jgi:glycosyltransferase involved in cell wall biosynthesis
LIPTVQASPARSSTLDPQGTIEYLGETCDVCSYFAALTVYVLPSNYREGIPRMALEAIGTGRAIITNDSPGCRETVAG